MKVKNIGDKTMEPEYDVSKMKKRPNPFAKQLKKQIAISLGIDAIALELSSVTFIKCDRLLTS